MTVVLFEPHLDDAVLFASYTLLQHRPVVVTVLGDNRVQERYGITSDVRRREHASAMRVLGIESAVWAFRDDIQDWDEISDSVGSLRNGAHLYAEITQVWAPLPEVRGHEQHTAIAQIVERTFDRSITSFYATYRRGDRRTRTETEVIPEPHWPALKMRAMACYTSQINLENTRPWFAADDMLREWVA